MQNFSSEPGPVIKKARVESLSLKSRQSSSKNAKDSCDVTFFTGCQNGNLC